MLHDHDSGQPIISVPITRRAFLGGAAATSLIAVLNGEASASQPLRDHLASLADVAPSASPVQPTRSFEIVREADLALIDISFHDFRRKVIRGVTTLVPASASNYVVVQFPPQAIGEAIYTLTTAPQWNVDPPPVLSVMAGPSRLCFNVPMSQSIPMPHMVAEELLDWSSWTLLVPSGAEVSSRVGGAVPADPSHTPNHTFVEYPAGLYLSPTVAGPSAPAPFTTSVVSRAAPLSGPNGVTDVWTAGLLQQSSTGEALESQAVAVWSLDFAGFNSVTPETTIGY